VVCGLLTKEGVKKKTPHIYKLFPSIIFPSVIIKTFIYSASPVPLTKKMVMKEQIQNIGSATSENEEEDIEDISQLFDEGIESVEYMG